MPPVPSVPAKEIIKALERVGYYLDRQSGSHVILKHAKRKTLSIPRHNPVKRGTLRSLISSAGFSVAEFVDLLRR
jgi:predicted RNA binding protein YcfA (HicA-like mRNA interferase family)